MSDPSKSFALAMPRGGCEVATPFNGASWFDLLMARDLINCTIEVGPIFDECLVTVTRMKLEERPGLHGKPVLQQTIEEGPDGKMRGVTYTEHYLISSLFLEAVRRADKDGNPD